MIETKEQFNHLYKVISSKKFLNKEALGGEIPFFISAYNAKKEILVRKSIELLKNKLESSGVPVLELDLYKISLEIIEEEIGLEEFFEIETEMGKDEFKDAIQSVLEIQEVLMPRIKRKIEKANAKVYLLTGIGLVYPYLRSHNILNNLQNIAKDAPTVAFFPGVYNGVSLNLFGLMKDDNYYRAFNIEKIKF